LREPAQADGYRQHDPAQAEHHRQAHEQWYHQDYEEFCREFYYGTISGMLSPC
jgi:hypothetical protein